MYCVRAIDFYSIFKLIAMLLKHRPDKANQNPIRQVIQPFVIFRV